MSRKGTEKEVGAKSVVKKNIFCPRIHENSKEERLCQKLRINSVSLECREQKQNCALKNKKQ